MLKAFRNPVGEGSQAAAQGTKFGFTLDESGLKQ